MWQFLYVFRLAVFILGFIGFFISYRYVVDSRCIYSLISFTLMGVGAFLTIGFICKSSKLKENVESRKSLYYVLGWKLLLILACSIFVVYDKLLEASGGSYGWSQKLSLATWMILGIFGIACGIGVELATVGARHAFSRDSSTRKYFDLSRVKKTIGYYSSISIVLCICICLCYATNKQDKTFDLSYLKIATPSEETILYLSSHPEITVEAYFDKDNEVRTYVEKYFSLLTSRLSNLSIEYIDLDASPAKAKKMDISKNGYVIFIDTSKDNINKLFVNDEIDSARKVLRNFDNEVKTHLKELVEKTKTIYFTNSHLEYSIQDVGKDPFKSFKALSKLFSQLNYNVKTLSSPELISGIPEDATCLMVLAPHGSFLSKELESIDKYLNKGGCLVAFMDSLGGSDGKQVLGSDGLGIYLKSKGLVYNKVVLANSSTRVEFFHSSVDNWFLATNNYSKNPITQTLQVLGKQAVTLMIGSGYFNFVPNKEGWSYNSLVRTLPATFIDKNLNYTQDKNETSELEPVDLVISSSKPVSLSIDTETKDKDKNTTNSSKKEARMVLFGTASISSDALLENTANKVLILEAFRWAFSDETMFTSSSSEEDVKIQHTKKENIVWFNVTVFGVPVLILLIGFIVLRVMRKKQ